MHELECFHQLVDDVLLVNLLQDVGSNNGMEVSLCDGERNVAGNPENTEAMGIAGVRHEHKGNAWCSWYHLVSGHPMLQVHKFWLRAPGHHDERFERKKIPPYFVSMIYRGRRETRSALYAAQPLDSFCA